VREVFERHRPEVVFHAAAHKHVPLMEQNVCEAVRNNVRGTRTLAEVALSAGCAEMVLISTDKAVNPSSVMGATKRVAEMVMWSLNRPGGTRFVAVRFGNVLGSSGSAVRVFNDQIARGGPVTVTHPEIARYFMLIPEAVQLVLHAAAGAEAGAIFVLDMGEPIKVLDLARNLIRLSGFVPDEEIEIRFIGLRPGEKLTEQLWEEGEMVEPSGIEKVWRLKGPTVTGDIIRSKVARLEEAADAGREIDVLAMLGDLVPTFRTGAHDAPRTPTVVPMRRRETGRSDQA
jgi:FlaA1/EpsC-like NDP-sugar epimerase